MLQKGTMRPLKKILGVILLIAGIGLIAMPKQTAEILCNQKILFGAIVAVSGYFLAISGRQTR